MKLHRIALIQLRNEKRFMHFNCQTVSLINIVESHYPFLPFSSGWTTSSTEAVHQLWPNAQPRHNQRLGKSISSSYELEKNA